MNAGDSGNNNSDAGRLKSAFGQLGNVKGHILWGGRQCGYFAFFAKFYKALKA
jgi:hypothetical protein